MQWIRPITPTTLLAGAIAVVGCGDVPVDATGGFPVAGVLEGSVTYSGPPPCSQGGHVVGNAVILVFDARNPPPPRGLGNTAANFGVIAGDALFADLPVTAGADKVCPPADSATVEATAPFVISPLDAGSYVVEAFFDTTGDFFPTLKPRNLPEATDIGGGFIDVTEAAAYETNPNYVPTFLPVNVGVADAIPATSLHGVPDFTMPPQGFVASGVSVAIGARLTLARPYFYPEGAVLPAGQSNDRVVIDSEATSTAQRPAQPAPTDQNPDGNVDFVPVLSFPQDILVYAEPTTSAVADFAHGGPAIIDAYQASFPQLVLHAGVPTGEQFVAADTLDVGNPFHMQLGLPDPPPGAAPGGNGGLFVWWNTCQGLPRCDSAQNDFIPENAQVYRMWPLVVLAKLRDLAPGQNQPAPDDVQSVTVQGADLAAPVVIIQGITLFGDSLAGTTTAASLLTGGQVGPPPAAPSKPVDHVSVMLRPSTLCLDPRAPDSGGVLVAPGASIDPKTQAILGPYPPSDVDDLASGTPGVVVDSHVLSNGQLAQLVNRKASGTTNGLLAGCLPTGRYAINVVYPTGQAWTTPNEAGSCAAEEGDTVFPEPGAGPGLVGSCSGKPRPALYSQGTRAVIEITPTTNPANCQAASPTDGSIPSVPFACTSLCPSPRLDPTSSPPCSACLDPRLDPNGSPPCSAEQVP
jgi:hypothetical protein